MNGLALRLVLKQRQKRLGNGLFIKGIFASPSKKGKPN